MQTVEAEIDKEGNVRLKESINQTRREAKGTGYYPRSAKRDLGFSITE